MQILGPEINYHKVCYALLAEVLLCYILRSLHVCVVCPFGKKDDSTTMEVAQLMSCTGCRNAVKSASEKRGGHYASWLSDAYRVRDDSNNSFLRVIQRQVAWRCPIPDGGHDPNMWT